MAPSPPRSSRRIRSSHLRIMDEQHSEEATDPTTPERSPTHALYPTYPQPDGSRRPETTSLVVRPSKQTCRTPHHRPPLLSRLYTYTCTQPHLIKSNPIQSTKSYPIPTQPASQLHLSVCAAAPSASSHAPQIRATALPASTSSAHVREGLPDSHFAQTPRGLEDDFVYYSITI